MRTLVLAAVCIFAIGCHREPVGTILEYELVMDDAPPGATADLGRAREIVDHRINFDQTRGQVTIEGDQIRVGVYGHDPKIVAEVERRAPPGVLVEFLILADRRDPENRQLIEIAETDTANKHVCVKDEDGEALGKWVWADADQMGQYQNDELVTRQRADDKLQVLCVYAPATLTGAYLEGAFSGFDHKGHPEVRFAFDDRGAMMMGELTGNNVPIGDLYRHLGIVLDGQLITAPRIQAAIYGGGIINGNFTQAETDALAAKMLAGMMPGPLRLVSKREIAEKTH